jgi:hypothetical protein
LRTSVTQGRPASDAINFASLVDLTPGTVAFAAQ